MKNLRFRYLCQEVLDSLIARGWKFRVTSLDQSKPKLPLLRRVRPVILGIQRGPGFDERLFVGTMLWPGGTQ